MEKTTSLVVKVGPCLVTAQQAASSIDLTKYVIGSDKISVTIPNFAQTPSCGDKVSYSITGAPSYVTVPDPSKAEIVIQGDNRKEAGLHKITLTVKASVS